MPVNYNKYKFENPYGTHDPCHVAHNILKYDSDSHNKIMQRNGGTIIASVFYRWRFYNQTYIKWPLPLC